MFVYVPPVRRYYYEVLRIEFYFGNVCICIYGNIGDVVFFTTLLGVDVEYKVFNYEVHIT